MGGLVSGVNHLLGGGSNNAGFTATNANTTNYVDPSQIAAGLGQAGQALNGQSQFANSLAPGGAQGLAAQSQLLAQLQQQAQGGGPNVALDQLNQTTSQNIEQQAAQMAGQRGAGANPALIAEQAARQGAAIQQNAAGQAATLQAQQQLAAQSALANLAGQQVGQANTGLNQYTNAAQANQNALLNAGQAQNQNALSNQANVNNANAGLAGVNANNSAKFISGAINGISGISALNSGGGGGAAAMAAGAATGGEIVAKENPKLAQVPANQRFSLKVPPHVKAMAEIYHPHMLSDGGKVKYDQGAKVVTGKAQVKGDSPKNDKVPAVLSPGEVVLPRSVMNAEDPAKAAADFVRAIKNKGKEIEPAKGGEKESPEEFKAALKRQVGKGK